MLRAELITTHTTGRDTNPMVLKLRAMTHKCAARDSQVCRRAFRIFENKSIRIAIKTAGKHARVECTLSIGELVIIWHFPIALMML